jgi:hypothetical protein
MTAPIRLPGWLLLIVLAGLLLPASVQSVVLASPGEMQPDGDDEDDQDDEDEDGGLDELGDEDEEETAKVDPTVKAAVEEVITSGVRYTLKAENRIDITYTMDEQGELSDFDAKGFDKTSIHEISSYHGAQSGPGLEIGAGSRRAGFLQHNLPLTGDFEIELEMWVNVNTPSAVLCFTFAKKVGVLWGQSVCKPKSMRPYNKRSRPDKNLFGGERLVKFKWILKDGELTIRANGRKTDVRRFKKGELDTVKFGVMAKNIRFAITNLKIKGTVDPSKL